MGGTILIWMDFNPCKKERERDGNGASEVPWGSKNVFINLLWKKEKAKEAKPKVVIFLQLGQVGF